MCQSQVLSNRPLVHSLQGYFRRLFERCFAHQYFEEAALSLSQVASVFPGKSLYLEWNPWVNSQHQEESTYLLYVAERVVFGVCDVALKWDLLQLHMLRRRICKSTPSTVIPVPARTLRSLPHPKI